MKKHIVIILLCDFLFLIGVWTPLNVIVAISYIFYFINVPNPFQKKMLCYFIFINIFLLVSLIIILNKKYESEQHAKIIYYSEMLYEIEHKI